MLESEGVATRFPRQQHSLPSACARVKPPERRKAEGSRPAEVINAALDAAHFINDKRPPTDPDDDE